MNQDVLELFNILTDVNFKNLFSIFDDVCKIKRDLNSFMNTGNLIYFKIPLIENTLLINVFNFFFSFR